MVSSHPTTLAGDDPLPLWMCWAVVAVFAAVGMWLAHSGFKKSIKQLKTQRCMRLAKVHSQQITH